MRKITLIFLLVGTVFKSHAQELISGVVSDEFGILEGANVFIKNSKKGTISNSEGNFQINAKKGDTVSISFMGYKTKDVVVSNQKNIDVILDSNILLDEIIVNAYGTITTTCVIECFKYTTGCGTCVLETKIESVKEDSNENQIVLFPNPSNNGLFKLNLLKDYQMVEIQISNISGQLISHKNYLGVNKKFNIDLSQFPKGMYLINIIADGERLETKKAIRS